MLSPFSWPRVAIAVLLVVGFTTGSRADVIDGGFELAAPGAATGTTYFNAGQSIDGGFWNVTAGSVGVDTTNNYVFDGAKSVFLTADGDTDSLSQTIATSVGQKYTISFYANADTDNTFSLTFGGVAVTGVPTTITQNGFPSTIYLGNSSRFVLYSGTAMATSASTALTFSSVSFGTVEIDDVSVVAASVPEPSTLAQVGIVGLIGLGCSWLRRKRAIAGSKRAPLA